MPARLLWNDVSLRQMTCLPFLADCHRRAAGRWIYRLPGNTLISKGSVKGVLEIFNRGKLPQDAQWMNLLDSMASQAAIAIDNATLYDDAQKANINLRQAYDATIEGWARALNCVMATRKATLTAWQTWLFNLRVRSGLVKMDMVDLRRGALAA